MIFGPQNCIPASRHIANASRSDDGNRNGICNLRHEREGAHLGRKVSKGGAAKKHAAVAACFVTLGDDRIGTVPFENDGLSHGGG